MARFNENFEYKLDFPKFLLIGDSITERSANPLPVTDYIADGYDHSGKYSTDKGPMEFCFFGQLQHDYVRRMDVINRGFSGYNSEYWKFMIDKVLQIEHDLSYNKCKIVSLFLGTNDAATAKPDGVPYDEFLSNMDYIINQILKRDIKIIVVGPGHHYPDLWEPLNMEEIEVGITRTNEINRKYADCLQNLCEKYSLPFVDLYKIHDEYNAKNGEEATRDLILDGIHFTAKGYILFYEQFTKTLTEWYPELSVPKMKMRLPRWDEFDSSQVEKIDI